MIKLVNEPRFFGFQDAVLIPGVGFDGGGALARNGEETVSDGPTAVHGKSMA